MKKMRFLIKSFKKYIFYPVQRNIRLKLFLIIIIVAIVPLTVATIISNKNSLEAMEQEILRQNSFKIDWADREFNDSIKRIDESLTAFYFDDNVQFYLNKLNSKNRLQNMGLTFFDNKLTNYLLANYVDFESVSFYILEEKKVYHASIEKGFLSGSISEGFIERSPIFDTENNFFYIENNLAKYYSNNLNESKGYYMTKYYRRFDDQKIMAILVVKLKEELFKKTINLLDMEDGNQIFLLNGRGELVYNYKYYIKQNDFISEIFNKIKDLQEKNYFKYRKNYVFAEQLSSDLYLVKTIPISVASNFYRETLYSQLAIIYITSVLILIIIIFIGRYITNPIVTLTKSMQNIELYLDSDNLPTTQVKSNDEIKVLEKSYLAMLQRIKDLIDQEYKQKIEMREAQLMALQAQINPHFMYNTLQMIGAMAVEKDSMEIYRLISAFSNMMRYNMRLTDDLVTIEQELNNVYDYLQIQEMRFDRKLNVRYYIDENTKKEMIPKLSIQPIVENCFKHGFINQSQIWQIDIRIYIDDDIIVVRIKDNGQGIRPGDLKSIRQNIKKPTETIFTHLEDLGLKNIDSRIKLHYGGEYGLSIFSEFGIGTELVLKIGLSSHSKEDRND